MEQYTTGYSANASLAMIAEWSKVKGIWEKLEAGVHIQQKVVIHTPQEKLKDLMINIWAGGEGVADVNYRVRTDAALQKLFGREVCAEQSTISETVNASTAVNVKEMEAVVNQILRECSQCYRHDYDKSWMVLDIDLTGLLAGKKAEGSEKGYFSGKRNGRGRQVGRVLASQYDEIVYEQLYPGKVQLEVSLLELVKRTEDVLDLDENRRKRTILRVDGGGGTDQNIDWLLGHGYWMLMKVKNWQRTQKLVKTVKGWQNLSELPGHEVGWVEQPHEYTKATRQLAVRWMNKKKWQYCVLVFNLTDLMIFQLAGLLMPELCTQPELFSAILKAYNLRSGGVETSIKNSKQGLGLNKRNKKRFHAQQMLLLLAQLAYNITVWVRNLLAQHSPLIASFGILRMIRDAFRISGRVQFNDKGHIVLIVLNQSHKLANAFQQTWQLCFPQNDLPLILGKT